DLAVQTPVGQHPRIAGLALPDQRGLVPTRAREVPVHAVVRGVQLPAHEPLRVRRVPDEDLPPRLEPVELPRPLLPEPLGIPRGPLVDPGVRSVRAHPELLRRWETARFREQRLQVTLAYGHSAPPGSRTSGSSP